MQVRGLLIAVGLLALLSGALWWSNKNPAEPEKKSTGNMKSVPLMTLLQADVVEATVARKDEAPLTLRKNSAGMWDMVLEPKLPTNSQAAMNVVTAISGISTEVLVDENATDLIQYGLEPAQITLELKDKTGKIQKLLVGDAAPVGSQFYVRKPNEKKVYAFAQHYREDFNKTVTDLRDKRLLLVDESKLTRIELLRKSDSLEFSRNTRGIWQLTKPQAYRTDAVAVDELFNKVKEANFDPALSEEILKKQMTSFAAAPVAATMKFTEGTIARQIEIRKTKDNEFLSKSSSVDGIYKVSDDLGKALDKTLDEFRSKKLMDFGYEDPVRIQIESSGKTSVIEHKGSDWTLNGKKSDAATLMPFLDALRALEALKFVASGFTKPSYTITVTQKDGKTTEKLLVSREGNFHYARREGETGEYEIDPKVLSDLDNLLTKVKEPGATKK